MNNKPKARRMFKTKLKIALLLIVLSLAVQPGVSSWAQNAEDQSGAWIVDPQATVEQPVTRVEEDTQSTYRKALNSARQKLFEAYFEVKTELKNQEFQTDELQRQKEDAEMKIERLKQSLEKLDASLGKLENEMQALEQRIRRQGKEIILTSKVIRKKNEQADKLKETLQEITHELYLKSQDSTLDILLDSNTFSAALGNMQTLELLEQSGQELYVELQTVEQDLQESKQKQKEKKIHLEDLKASLDLKKIELRSLEEGKINLLESLHEEADSYAGELESLQAESDFIDDKANALYESLTSLGLTDKLRKLEAEFGDKYGAFGTASFVWPVNPSYKGISAFYDDPGYLRLFGFSHKAIDIPEPTGTPIRAVADGYVYQAEDPEDASYNAIFLLHSNSLMTVYGHASEVWVAEGVLVKQGEIIGLTGGAPGSLGAGRYTTGPHLHFEVREAGERKNPLNYLP